MTRHLFLVVALVVAAGALAACSGSDTAADLSTTTTARHGGPDGTVAPATDRPVAAADTDPRRETTLIATVDHDIDGYDVPDGDVVGTVASTWHGRTSALPVIDEQPGWLHVRLAPRPNGSTAWVRRSDVSLSTTPYRIEVDVTTMRLRLYERGRVVLDAPAGVGTEATPTVTGEHFLAFFQEAPSAGYGPFVLVTSAHSEAITDWQESGDAIIAVHGPLGSSDEIGTTGARVSNGCIRLHVDDLLRLRAVPAGSPIDIIASNVGSSPG